MERKKSNGQPFQMRSGNSSETGTPYPFLGKLVGGAVKGFKNLLPGSRGNSGGSAGGAVNLKDQIAEIHEKVVTSANEAEGGKVGGGLIGNIIDEDEMALAKAEESGLTKNKKY